METIDVCGLSCPEPVLLTQEALKSLAKGESLEVLVDSAASRENIRRMAAHKGWVVVSEEITAGFRLIISPKL